jgi:hypothetical protein
MQLSYFDPFMRTALSAARDCRLVLVKSQFLAGEAWSTSSTGTVGQIYWP